MVATASKASIFFIILCLLRKQSQITAWVESSECPIQTLIGRGISGEHGALSTENGVLMITPRSDVSSSQLFRQAEQLYIGRHDVQTQPVVFLNKLAIGRAKMRSSAFIFRNAPRFATRNFQQLEIFIQVH
jgi:hypothetical protein